MTGKSADSVVPAIQAEPVPLEEVERRYVLHVLERSAGNKRLAARVLDVDRKTLYRKLKRWGVLTDDTEE